VYRWELDGPAQQEFADLPPAARVSLAAFMDAVVIVDPVQYQRRRDERDDVFMPLRSLHFGPDGGGLVTFLVYPPDDLVLVVKSSGSVVSNAWLSSGILCHPPDGLSVPALVRDTDAVKERQHPLTLGTAIKDQATCLDEPCQRFLRTAAQVFGSALPAELGFPGSGHALEGRVVKADDA
jgi:hypothetical protein